MPAPLHWQGKGRDLREHETRGIFRGRSNAGVSVASPVVAPPSILVIQSRIPERLFPLTIRVFSGISNIRTTHLRLWGGKYLPLFGAKGDSGSPTDPQPLSTDVHQECPRLTRGADRWRAAVEGEDGTGGDSAFVAAWIRTEQPWNKCREGGKNFSCMPAGNAGQLVIAVVLGKYYGADRLGPLI